MVRKTHNPYPLFEAIRQEFDLPSDAYLAKFLRVTAPAISKVRSGTSTFTADLILAVYDATGWSIEEIRGHLNGTNARKQSQVFSNEDT